MRLEVRSGMSKQGYYELLKSNNIDLYIPLYEEIERDALASNPDMGIIYGRAKLFITYHLDDKYLCDFRHLKKQITVYFEIQYDEILKRIIPNHIPVNYGKGINEGFIYFAINNSSDIPVILELIKSIR